MTDFIVVPAYDYSELSECAKAMARDCYRTSACDDDWCASIVEKFATICAILGIRLATRTVPLMDGGTRQEPRIHVSGFGTPYNGACFAGTYFHVNGAASRLKAHAPCDDSLHRIAGALQAIQRRNFYQLQATIGYRGRSCDEFSMEIAVERVSAACRDTSSDTQEAVRDAMRALAAWLRNRLEEEWAYLISDTMVEEEILAIGPCFRSDGEPFR